MRPSVAQPHPAILGTSDQCVATHPSDLAVALSALDAVVIMRDSVVITAIPVADFFRQPGDTPDQEHDLQPGELIVAVEVPGTSTAGRAT